MKINLQNHWGNAEVFNAAELSSKIIYSMQTTGQAYLHTAEGGSGHDNGFFKLLDELCNYWQWDKSLITVVTTNRFHTHPEYNVIWNDSFLAAHFFNIHSPIFPWSGEKYYGMFIGRANSPRIYAGQLHSKFEYKQYGLTSFNDDLTQFMIYPELIDYFFHSNQTYKEMCSLKPYSDIGPVTPPPIVPMKQNEIAWPAVYKKIAIELVCETSKTANCSASISEKILRPLYYKRPFLLIGPPGMLAFLNEIGYKTFGEFFPEDYDNLEGIPRVIRIFDILHELIKSKAIDTLVDKSNDILMHNHTLVKQHINHYKSIQYQTFIEKT